jgi:hypothetical protein
MEEDEANVSVNKFTKQEKTLLLTVKAAFDVLPNAKTPSVISPKMNSSYGITPVSRHTEKLEVL